MRIQSPIVLSLLLAACTPATGPGPQNAGDASRKPGLGPVETVPELPGPEGCADAPLVSVEEMAKGVRAGARIAVDVVPQAEVMCTLLFCTAPEGTPREEVCCNGCGGGYGVRLETRFHLQFANLGGCGGMDCNLHCEPFGRQPTHMYRFVGKNEFKPAYESGAVYSKSMFTVEKVCRVEGTVLAPNK